MADNEDKIEGTPEEVKTFGTWLKNQRLAKKVPLEEIAAVTKIHIQQLRGLEDGWNENLPAMTIVRGIAVNYCKHLGLNEAEVMEQFKQHKGEFKEKASTFVKAQPPSTYTPQSGKPLRFGSYSERKDQLKLTHWVSTKRTLYAALVVLGFIFLIFLMRLGKKATEEVTLTPPAVIDNREALPQPQETKIVDQAQSPTTLFAGNPPYEFNIVAAGDVWFNMQVDEQSLTSFKLSVGQNKIVNFNRKARVTFSNPLLTRFEIAGSSYKSTAPLGKDETVIFPEESSKLVAEKK